MSEPFSWRPVRDYADVSVPTLPIEEPPCKHCSFFTPRIKTDALGHKNGVVICSSGRMHNDFSCFQLKMKRKDR